MADLPLCKLLHLDIFPNAALTLLVLSLLNYQEWIVAVFVCFVTKAVHLELVSNLTRDACIMALKKTVIKAQNSAKDL